MPATPRRKPISATLQPDSGWGADPDVGHYSATIRLESPDRPFLNGEVEWSTDMGPVYRQDGPSGATYRVTGRYKSPTSAIRALKKQHMSSDQFKITTKFKDEDVFRTAEMIQQYGPRGFNALADINKTMLGG